ncbi:efflux RND transporter permease subunit [Flammeovirga agarivorans]|uniref:Efflux RND transporter permease subunit n=1 Tax=Flammeovirga agarivorans TaxID=2726742 RepID=A0A7X8XWH3_9BACT|nr:efflux RND transporter permease subunit [Flammeovirga agarivorans]NLR92209.1 efflux RND transporter permease subunit [Flammeovirga agarivorans]
MINKIVRFFLYNRIVTIVMLLLVVFWGLMHSPFKTKINNYIPYDPVSVDAIPDIGDNQQIVFTNWSGRSPQDIEDQITYPLTTSLLGIPGVKSIRSNSMFGFSTINIIFKDDIEFYFGRTRILEKINSLSPGTLPEGVQPTLGPDATAVGQVFWYTLEGRDEEGNPTGGWDLEELRTTQDFLVKYALMSADGVAEVASVGGHVKEYQIDVDPNALKAYGVTLQQVMNAVRNSNLDVGARTIEVNNTEYFVRGIGYIKNLSDLEESVVKVNANIPIRIKDVAKVLEGPAVRRGILDKEGAEAVGGVVTARFGANPMLVVDHVKDKIKDIQNGLPQKVLEDGTVSKMTIVPFYDRSVLIKETLGTLNEALTQEILITVIVVLIMVWNLRASMLISSLLPIAVLMVFIIMKYMGIVANIVSLSGIAIAIGTMVDIGIVMSENLIKHLEYREDRKLVDLIYDSTAEVSGAIVTAVATTVVSFIPVFTLQASEGKLFTPLAFTKTFALCASVVVALVFLPMFAYYFFRSNEKSKGRLLLQICFFIFGIWLLFYSKVSLGIGVILITSYNIFGEYIKGFLPQGSYDKIRSILVALVITYLLAIDWLPLGAQESTFKNVIFVGGLITLILGGFQLFIYLYPKLLAKCLENKVSFLTLIFIVVFSGISAWLGFPKLFSPFTDVGKKLGVDITQTSAYKNMSALFPGIGSEFMPSLSEGSFLLMPTTMPNAGISEVKKNLQLMDMAVKSIPEISSVVGKAGRTQSPLDPAPISMYENIINYKNEYKVDENGTRLRFKINSEGEYVRDEKGKLIEDPDGQYFRQWRDHIQSTDDIWNEIVKVSSLPGLTSAPKLQPIETRLIMTQTGMRAPMGIKVYGPDLATIESFGLQLEQLLKEVPSVKKEAVFADRIVGKPYLEIEIDRQKIARYGMNIRDMQMLLEMVIGGMPLTYTVEGRERFPVRMRYAREYRDNPDVLKKFLVNVPLGIQVPLEELADINYVAGPQSIKSEDTFLTGYVLLDKKEGFSEVQVVDQSMEYLQSKINSGKLVVPKGVSFKFSGNYENQLRATKRLSFVMPICLMLIFFILYLQFKSVRTTFMVFSGIAVAFSGGFLMLWLYSKPGFLDVTILGTNMQDLFNVGSVNLSVAVWVGFIALFGIATDDGVLIATYLDQSFSRHQPKTIAGIRKAVLEGGMRRIRPSLMTTATTLLAFIPILTSTGRGADIMKPMAIPGFGGMTVALLTLFVVPTLYCAVEEASLLKSKR